MSDKKKNLLVDHFPEVASQWDHEKNDLDLSYITSSSGRKVWWVCRDKDIPHSWSAKVYTRTRLGRGCPICSNQLIVPGINSLADTDPEICAEWDHTKNEKTPSEISRGSKYKAYWVCSHNSSHTWTATVNNRTNKDSQCPMCSRPGGFLRNHLLEEFAEDLNQGIDPTTFSINSHTPVWWRCSQDPSHMWKVSPNQRTSHGTGCPSCSGKISKMEQELADYVAQTEDVVLNSRDIISPYEIDVYVPSKRIAFEFNGVLWHSDKYIDDKNYHKRKVDMCNSKGIQLFMVWEDDWKYRNSIVKRMIDVRLGNSRESTVYARKTYVDSSLTVSEIRDFQESNHIQGYGAGSIRIGLRETETDDLVATMSLKRKSPETLELVRYCTSKSVVGGHSKLIKWVEGNIDCMVITTFADLSVSNGNLYQTTGWSTEKILPPDYTYLYAGQRRHKFNFRKKSFETNPHLIFESGKTEQELAALNSLHRVYDCGKIKYTKVKSDLI